MAHIVSLKVEGLAGSTEAVKYKLNRGVNVFYGANGSGKTSLLRILDSAMNGNTGELWRVPFESAEVTIHSDNHKRNFVRTIEHRQLAATQTTHMRTSGEVSFDPDTGAVDLLESVSRWTTTPSDHKASRARWRHVYLPSWRAFSSGESRTIVHGTADDQEYQWDDLFARRLEELWVSYSNVVLDEVRTIQGDGLVDILRGVLGTGPTKREARERAAELDASSAYDRVTAFLQRQGAKSVGTQRSFSRRYTEDPQLRQVVGDIDRIERRIEEATESRDTLERLTKGFFSRKSINFTYKGIEVESAKGEEIRLESLSAGEKQALRIFIDVLRAEGNSLLLDEPEIALHIDWQRALIPSMRSLNPGAQLILATHSPEMMAEIPDTAVFPL